MIPSATDRLPYGASPPTSWGVIPFRYLATVTNGYAFKSDEWQDSGTPIIRIGNLNGSENFNYSNLALSDKYRVKAGDLLFSWSGNPGTSFGPFRWSRPGAHFLNQHIFKVAAYGCEKDWLYWALKAATHWIERELTSGMIGMVHVTKEELGSVPIPVPSSDEQLRIAGYLDAETTRIDRLAGDRLRQRAILDEHSYAEVSETLLPGVLTAPAADCPWFWLPRIPADSPLVRLRYVCRLQNGLTVDEKRDVSGDTVTRPYLRVANVQAGYVDLTSVAEVTVPREIAKRCTLQPGDVLMTEGGDLDKLGRGTVWKAQLPDCLHQNHVFALRPEPDRLDGEYLTFMTQTVHGRSYFESTGSRTTNLASTNSSKILSFPIPLPSLTRQRELVRSVRSRLDAIARVRRELDHQLELLAERRQALVNAAVTGQIDVSTASGRGIED